MENTVFKFGGTSVAQEYKKIATIVGEKKPKYVVVSAPGKRDDNDVKVTDMLIDLTKKSEDLDKVYDVIDRFKGIGDDSKLSWLEEELKNRCRSSGEDRNERIVAFGEYGAGVVLAPVLGLDFCDPKNFIRVDNHKFAGTFDLDKVSQSGVVPGFYGANAQEGVATFSRGGSDLTGAILASAFGLEYHNFTDSPIKCMDPRLVDNPKEISEMTYRELRFLTLSGFSIIHQDVWQLMERAKLPLIVRGTKDFPRKGTIVTPERLLRKDDFITGISYQDNFVILTVDSKKSENSGFEYNLYSVFKEYGLNITTSAGGLTDTSFLIDKKQLNTSSLNLLLNRFTGMGYDVQHRDNLACLVCVGEEMKGRRGLLAKISGEISVSGNNIYFVSQSGCEKSIVFAIDGNGKGKETLRALNKAFL